MAAVESPAMVKMRNLSTWSRQVAEREMPGGGEYDTTGRVPAGTRPVTSSEFRPRRIDVALARDLVGRDLDDAVLGAVEAVLVVVLAADLRVETGELAVLDDH